MTSQFYHLNSRDQNKRKASDNVKRSVRIGQSIRMDDAPESPENIKTIHNNANRVIGTAETCAKWDMVS